MRNGGPLILSLLLTGCTDPRAPSAPPEPRESAPVCGLRSLASVDLDWKSASLESVFARLGEPDREVGSGIYIYEYHLEDGSSLLIGSADHKSILYVRRVRGTNGDDEILYPCAERGNAAKALIDSPRP